MILIDNIDVYGWEAAIRGMRNPMNSWDNSDTEIIEDEYGVYIDIGEKDWDLMVKLVSAGSCHSKFMRMLNITCDITAPLYWWKEFDTYKVGTVSNSCSTMHAIHKREIRLADFSYENMEIEDECVDLSDCFINVVADCEMLRQKFIVTGDKKYWRALIQLLPSSYNQKRTIQMNYEVASRMYFDRRNHKLDEWRKFCETMVESLPAGDLIRIQSGE